MNTYPVVNILCGGVGPEREISLVSGESIFEALREQQPARLIELTSPELPSNLEAGRDVVFPALHGEFGEDGHLQRLLEDRGIHYAGSDACSSRLCIQKSETKLKVAAVEVPVAPGHYFHSDSPPDPESIVEELGTDLILKPDNMGSSVHLREVGSAGELVQALEALRPGAWLLEQRIRGREVSVGILGGRALGLVELQPAGGIYDYHAKYTAGETRYLYPAPVSPALTSEIRRLAERVFQSCGCRDFARIDFMISAGEQPCFIEVNTLPGLTPTSLLPKSASCFGYSFEQLAVELVRPALARFGTAHPLHNFEP